MELRHLRYFAAVAEGENVSRAATELRVSQPAVSRQLRDLEDGLGFALLARTGKSVRLTAAGRIFYGKARHILAHTTATTVRARAAVAAPAETHVGYVPSGTVEILPRALRVFRRCFPGVQVSLHDLSAEEMPPLLLQGKLNVALTVLRHRLPHELAKQEVARYEICIVVGTTHPLAKAKVVSLKQVASKPVATYSRKDYPGYNKHLAKIFAAIGRRPCIGSEHDSGSSLLAAVAAGHESALLPICARGVAQVHLRFLKLRPTLPPWSIVALWRKSAETEAVQAFVAAALTKQTGEKWSPLGDKEITDVPGRKLGVLGQASVCQQPRAIYDVTYHAKRETIPRNLTMGSVPRFSCYILRMNYLSNKPCCKLSCSSAIGKPLSIRAYRV